MKRIGQIFREKLAKDVTESVKGNEGVFVLNYSQLTAKKMGELRKELSGAGAQVFISKNRVTQLALKELGHDKLAERIIGQTALVWGNTDSSAISKILVKFTTDHEAVKVRGGLLDGKFIEVADVKRLSELPSREVLLAKLLGTMQAPMTRLAYILNGKTRELLSILKQLSDKKGGN